ncbi:MAG: tRNA lysidine(34) synthetase TilS [Clostridia bacterium]
MLDCVRDTIREYEMILPQEKVLVAVSGGADSMALLHILKELQKEGLWVIHVAHVEHGIRGKASEEDARFVEKVCLEWNIPFHLKKVRVPELAKKWKLSYELAGRRVRYDFFMETLAKIGGQKIAVAHHMDDQAETLLLHLVRGSGGKGLGGMQPVREGKIIRPLIRVTRSQIEDYCRENHIHYRRDATNQERVYHRNRMRVDVIPYLKEHFNPDIVATLVRTAEILRQDEEYMDRKSREAFNSLLKRDENGLHICIEGFRDCHTAIQRRVLRLVFESLTGSMADVEYKHINEIIQLAASERAGLELDMPNGVKVRRGYTNLFFSLYNKKQLSYCYEVHVPGRVEIPEANGILYCGMLSSIPDGMLTGHSPFVQYFDADSWPKEAVIRNRKPGDRIQPLGSPGTKKLKDYFIDRKIDRWERDEIPIIAVGNRVLWVVGYDMADEVKVTGETKKFIKMEFVKNSLDFQ